MKGLLIKDWKLLKVQRNFVLIILAVCVLFLVKGQEMQTVFAYLSAVFSMLAVSTIGYDQENNGLNFIFTFPVSRGKYVLEKYVLGMLLAAFMAAAFSAGMLAADAAGASAYISQQYFAGVSAVLMPAVAILSVMIPLQLKYGSEKSRMVLLGIFGFVLLAAYAASKAAEVLHMDLMPAVERIRQAGPVETAVCLGVLAAGLMGISYMVSMSVMKRRQF